MSEVSYLHNTFCIIANIGFENFHLPFFQEVFCRLPLPYISEEFKIDSSWKDMDSKMEQPPPYVHIRRSILLVLLYAIVKQLLYSIKLEFV